MPLPLPARRPTCPPPRRRGPGLAALLLAATAASTAATHADDPRGRWLTANGNLEVDVAPCGAALCGTVSRVLANRSMSGSDAPMVPVDPRPALGLQLMAGFVRVSADGAEARWSGTLYNREDGRTYRCTMALADGGATLVLRPYIGLPLFGQTLRWTRVPGTADAAGQP